MSNSIQKPPENMTLAELLQTWPILRDFFENLRLSSLDLSLPPEDAILGLHPDMLADFELTPMEVYDQFLLFFDHFTTSDEGIADIQTLTLIGGNDKSGCPEECRLEVSPGEVISIVGPTGSGKSRLLEDIECLAQGDTPTGRRILLNHAPVPDEIRFGTQHRLVAQLTQNMNFVMDLTVRDFLEMHARCRLRPDTKEQIDACFDCAIRLSGEPFDLDTKVTQLSGGQSRALMIADTACISNSPIILVDEIENAGINRHEAIRLLAKEGRIVFLSTHDPVLALNASRRIVIKNGGISGILRTTEEERAGLAIIEQMDTVLHCVRDDLRRGERITVRDMHIQ
ncbi:MAG: ATP-binding cassette domain-containing protein [Lachnospiraceae bacterium]|nr:ATP-binding cassette domain-containing protein [Lachnospiraceae bacterium]